MLFSCLLYVGRKESRGTLLHSFLPIVMSSRVLNCTHALAHGFTFSVQRRSQTSVDNVAFGASLTKVLPCIETHKQLASFRPQAPPLPHNFNVSIPEQGNLGMRLMNSDLRSGGKITAHCCEQQYNNGIN